MGAHAIISHHKRCDRNRKPRKTEVVTRARNFLTAPPKAGHYGQGDSLLGHKSQEGRKLFAVAEEDYSAAERAIKVSEEGREAGLSVLPQPLQWMLNK